MNFVTCLAILTVIVAGVTTTNAVTNSTQDYYLSTVRKLTADIEAAEKRVAAVTEQANEHIKVFQIQHESVLLEIQRTEERFTTLETISYTRKLCVQNYKYQLISVSIANSQFASCIVTSQKRIATLTDGTKGHINSAKLNTNTYLPRQVTTCNTQHATNATKLEECVITQCDSYTNAVNTNLENVDKSLDASVCTMNDINKDTIKCSFVTENNVLVTIGSVSNKIDNCIIESGKPPCCSCSTTTPFPCPSPMTCPTPKPCPTSTTGPPFTATATATATATPGPCTTALPASNSTANEPSIRSIVMGARA